MFKLKPSQGSIESIRSDSERKQRSVMRFCDVVSDEVFNGQSITDGLRQWGIQQRDRLVKDQTVKKKLNGIIAVINCAKSELGLLVHYVRPKIDIVT